MTELIIISSIMLVIIGIIVLAFLGLLFVVRNDNIRKTMCTRKISAKIKDLKKKRSKQGWIFCPTYEYEFNGKIYNVYSKSRKYKDNIMLGKCENIYINPSKPSQIYENYDFEINKTLVIVFIIVVVLFSVSILGFWSSGLS